MIGGIWGITKINLDYNCLSKIIELFNFEVKLNILK